MNDDSTKRAWADIDRAIDAGAFIPHDEVRDLDLRDAMRDLVGIVRVHVAPSGVGDRDAIRELDGLFARLAPQVSRAETVERADVPPPDDDPAWKDVPAELARACFILAGDRVRTPSRGWQTVTTFTVSGSPPTWHAYITNSDGGWVSYDSQLDGPIWIKRHDHPARKPPVAEPPPMEQTADVIWRSRT